MGNEETLVWKNTKYMKATGDERNQKGGMNVKRMEAKAKKKNYNQGIKQERKKLAK